jgi:hypothetical protein
VSPTNWSINVGETKQFRATADYSDGSKKDVTSSATWTTDDAAIVSVNAGLATGLAPGTVNVTASFSGFNFVTILNVTGNGSLTTFSISQIKPSIPPSSTLQMFGYAEYSDGSSQWVTGTTHWTSSNASVASVQDQGAASPGLVTAGSSPGTATITASFGGLPAQSTTVMVAANAVPIDLMDMTASQNYLHVQGGLYGNGTDTVPASHDTAGKAAGTAVQPLDKNGSPSSAGKIVFLGIGMSNATEEFSAFASSPDVIAVLNPKVALEDGALGAATACYWTVAQGQTISACPDAKSVLLENQYDRVRDTVLTPAGVFENQVQVLWIKNANPRPGTPSNGLASLRTLCDATISGCVNDSGTEAIHYETQLGETIRAARSRYPNLKQIFLSTRIYAGYATDGLNPEPYAYEYGYSAKWLIAAQVVQESNPLTIDPVAGDMSYSSGPAAWAAWGTYLWADGTNKRSDGTEWLQSDFQMDGTHPDVQGTTKVVNLLKNFFTTSPYTPWFRP